MRLRVSVSICTFVLVQQVIVPVKLNNTQNFQLRVRDKSVAYNKARMHLHTSAYVSIRPHTSAYVWVRDKSVAYDKARMHLHTYAYVSIRQHTSAYVSIRPHSSAYASIRPHT